MAEMFFATPADMEQTLGSDEGKAAVAGIENFVSGGVMMLIGVRCRLRWTRGNLRGYAFGIQPTE